ncbi:MAG TPA: hypothetical protein VE398_09775 [Acidobacteriota bacterium]|nr:hypothetical protein [Acidobacteriota bacterium]
MALSRLGRLDEARRAFEEGRKKAAYDKRFPLELAGIAFKQGNAAESIRQLRHALKADPRDSYGNDFLATLYFLQGNLEASLKYWNRIGRPMIESVDTGTVPKLDPVLLDRALAFSPASRLDLKDLVLSRERLEWMDVFSTFRFELRPRRNGDFDLSFHALERDGGVLIKLLTSFKEIPYQTIRFDSFDIGGSASNFESFYRWDAQKRRAFAEYSGPLKGDPGWRLRLWLDGRNENWDVPHSGAGVSPILFKLRKLELGGGVSSIINDKWEWNADASISDRRFIGHPEGSVSSSLYADGPSVKYEAGLQWKVLYLPEKRLRAQSNVALEVAKVLSAGAKPYMKVDWGIRWEWLPLSRGDDYRFSGRLNAG